METRKRVVGERMRAYVLPMTVFVFSRRAIQSKLELLESVLSEEQHAKLVDRLNRLGRERLAAMWEVVFLQALSDVAKIHHEVALSDGRRPDFAFGFDYQGVRLPIVGDIACVSDSGLDARNPFDKFGYEIARLAHKYGLDPNHFRHDVHGEQVGKWPRQRMRLLLPTGQAFTDLVRDVVEPFVRELALSPRATAQFSHQVPDVYFSIGYDRSQWASGGGHPSYDTAMSLTENPIFLALRDKRQQLRAAPDDAIRLIVLCDGDCAAMRESVFHATGSNYSAKQIATEFLRKTSSVDLVMLVTVEKRNPNDLLLRDYVMSYDLAAAPPHARRPGLDDDTIEAVRVLLERAVRAIPKPMADACNAARRCEKEEYGLGKHGGYQRSGNMIRISARMVQELLAGEVTRRGSPSFTDGVLGRTTVRIHSHSGSAAAN